MSLFSFKMKMLDWRMDTIQSIYFLYPQDLIIERYIMMNHPEISRGNDKCYRAHLVDIFFIHVHYNTLHVIFGEMENN